jgi:hypothetical protein
MKMNALHKWTFKTRFRSRAYGWRASALGAKRLKEAVREIKKAAKSDPVLAGDGVVTLLERIWPSFQDIDTSSGTLGGAVNHTLDELIPVLVDAPADLRTRQKWMDRLYEALVEDGVDYLSSVEDRWGDICAFPELANHWADHMIPAVREGWENHRKGAWVVGATLCLSCLVKTERYQELQGLLSLQSAQAWHFGKFWAEALARQGQVDEAIAYAEGCRSVPYCNYDQITRFCERILLEAGRRAESYHRYGLVAAAATTNLAVFKETARKYPEQEPRQVLLDLIKARGDKGKWFAAAKDAGFRHDHLRPVPVMPVDRCAQPKTIGKEHFVFSEQEQPGLILLFLNRKGPGYARIAGVRPASGGLSPKRLPDLLHPIVGDLLAPLLNPGQQPAVIPGNNP